MGPPTPERSTGFFHVYVAGQGTAERWCVIALGKQVSTEGRPREGQRIYRVWEPGSAADELGRSWTPEDPRTYGPDGYRVVAGLPDRKNGGTIYPHPPEPRERVRVF